MFRILHQDEHLVAIDKPSGFSVHPPEDSTHRIPKRENCLALLRDQIGRYVYPVHRLDRATSGVLLFALDSASAEGIAAQFRARTVRKTYYCVVRGWVSPDGTIERELTAEHPALSALPSVTEFARVAECELPIASSRFPQSRYSLVLARPRTGRRHQIRRHFAGAAHPLVGDTLYGDSVHNRGFRALGVGGLLLKAHTLELTHPADGRELRLRSRWGKPWQAVFGLFGTCPWDGG